ncbi:NAD(P)/FAD-dependent oxidoreductase [Bacillus sp. EAC]|uniref:NAD(P)/FAD-dependent oxidoreductase n=1 Tax=Bacillus sp. EAC TaxID=1978338 RepID=UPI000B42F25C|nr:NAD(P)/FAD-dependent oxidoreductase [Bacillus sp. EAC]
MDNFYECVIIGGGFAGLQASIQLGRYKRQTLVIDSNYGRSTLCKTYRNILGWPGSVSGYELRELGKKHAEIYDVSFADDKVIRVKKEKHYFYVSTQNGMNYNTKTILLATGLLDRIPDINYLVDCLGASIYVCPDCDGYEILNKSVLVLGAGEVGAKMALTLTYWTKNIAYINHDGEDLQQELLTKLNQHGIHYEKENIKEVIKEGDSNFKGIVLNNGEKLYADRAFIGFGGNKVQNELAKQLDINLLNNKHVIVDPRTKETNVTNVWAAGDLVAHSQQVTIAIGEGTQAAVWIHKRLFEL